MILYPVTWPRLDPPPLVRLSPFSRRRTRRGEACPDETVAEARRMVEGSSDSLSRIARVLGIAVSTLSHWALNGGWLRPPTAPPWSSRFDPHGWGGRSSRLFEARRALREAESVLRHLEAAGPPAPAASGPALDRLAAALARLDEAAGLLRPDPSPPATPRGVAAGGAPRRTGPCP